MAKTLRKDFLRLAAAAIIAAPPAAAEILPPSSAHVRIVKAEVVELACARRPFKMEYTSDTAGWFPYMGEKIAASNWHPHTIILGVIGMVMLVPITVLAVPVDLAAGPFRRGCRFKLKLSGAIIQWAGKPVLDAPVSFRGANLLRQGIPGRSRSEFALFSAETVSGEDGKFSLETDCTIGSNKSLILRWKIKERDAGQMRLTKKGGSFVLTQPDAGFGVGAYEMEPMIIKAKKAGSP